MDRGRLLEASTMFRVFDRKLTQAEIISVMGDHGHTSSAVDITVHPVNDAPVLTLAVGEGTYNENGPATLIDVTAIVSDIDSADFAGGNLTTSISANGENDDRLFVQHQGTGVGQVNVTGNAIQIDGIQIATFSGGVGSGDDLLITFDADANVMDVQLVARQIAFMSVSEDPGTAQRTISMQLSDGDGGTSGIASRVMNVIGHNDTPVVLGPAAAYSVPETDQFGDSRNGLQRVRCRCGGRHADRLVECRRRSDIADCRRFRSFPLSPTTVPP